MSAYYTNVSNHFFSALTGFVKFCCVKTLGYKTQPKFRTDLE